MEKTISLPIEKTIIAIDPGNIESAFVVMQGVEIIQKGKYDNNKVLSFIYGFYELSDKAELYIEMVSSYGMPVGKTVFDTCVWIGRFYEAWVLTHPTGSKHPELIFRKDVKLHHCNATFAKDGNIITALKDKYGEKGTKKNPGFFFGVSKDVWQAIALATYILETNK